MSCSDTSASLAPTLASPASQNRGLTLIELLVTTAIIGLLALLAIPAYSEMRGLAREIRTIAELRDLEKMIIAYSIDKGGAYPPNLTAIGQTGRKDPWGGLYQYSPPVRAYMGPLNEDFDLYSMGEDGLTADDISEPASLDDVLRSGGSRGENGFIGLAEELVP